jgi:hypothetical protein
LQLQLPFAFVLVVILSEGAKRRVEGSLYFAFAFAVVLNNPHYKISTEIFPKPASKSNLQNEQPAIHLHHTIHHNLSTKPPPATPHPTENPSKIHQILPNHQAQKNPADKSSKARPRSGASSRCRKQESS